MIDVSVIICTYKRSKWLNNLLSSLEQQTFLPKEVIIVDASMVQTQYKIPSNLNVKKINSEVMALTYQRNLGVKKSEGDIILMLDDDVELNKDFIEKIIQPFIDDIDNKIGAISGYDSHGWGKDKSEVNQIIKFAKILGLYDGNFSPGSISRSGICVELNMLKPFIGLKKVNFYSGCSTAIRSEVYKKFMHPEKINKYGGEDKVFSAMISSRWGIYICGDARLKHFTAPGGARQGSYENAINIVRFNAFLHKIFNKKESYFKLKLYFIYLAIVNLIYSVYVLLFKINFKLSFNLLARGLGYIVGVIRHKRLEINLEL